MRLPYGLSDRSCMLQIQSHARALVIVLVVMKVPVNIRKRVAKADRSLVRYFDGELLQTCD